MTHPFQALSLSYKTAPLAVRERFALTEAASSYLLQQLHHELGLADVLVLSTCNRTEVYYSAATDHTTAVLAVLGSVTNTADMAPYAPFFSVFSTATSAAYHLFEVALGLEAQVLGDAQIIGQVKRAYQRSVAQQAAGPFLHRLLQTVLAAHKRVQQETAFRDGAASTASATLELIAELTATLARPRVLLVGLGDMGADVCRQFGKTRHSIEVTVCNRTDATTQALAATYGLRGLPFAELARGMQEADVVISAVAAPTPFFTRALVAPLAGGLPQCFLDLSMPRSVEPAVGDLPGLRVFSLDAIQQRTAAVLARRAAAEPHVRAILAECLAGFQAWSRELQVAPTIQKLKSRLEHARQQELARVQKHLSSAEAGRLEEVTKSLVQKLLKLPVQQLKAACQRDEADALVGLLSTLFDLEEPLLA